MNCAKKVTGILLLFVCIYIVNNTKVYGLSNNFLYIIDTVGIPRYNTYGQEINEWVYKIYNVFAYGNPDTMTSSDGQRWKGFKGGRWNRYGNGEAGEYYILGKNYSGSLIHNVRFPVDKAPSSPPTEWNYIEYKGALESWNDKNICKYNEQREYMKNVKLLFDDINYVIGSSDPYNLVEYNITANQIGLNKAKLDTASTWKTEGVIHVKKLSGGRVWEAVFATPPMAASANVKSKINVAQNNILNSDNEKIVIPIDYGGQAINLNGYAKKEHIKYIESVIYINGKKIDSISGSKTDTISKIINYEVSRDDLIIKQNNKFKVRIDTIMYTEFSVDGLMQDSKEVEFNIFAEANKPNNPIQHPLETKILKKYNNSWVVSPLNMLRNEPYIQGGQSIVTKIKLDSAIDDIKINIEGDNSINYIDNDTKNYFKEANIPNILTEIKKVDDTTYLFYSFIPFGTKSTINSWNTLRNDTNNYFDINRNDVSKSTNRNYKINVDVYKSGYKFSQEYNFNVFDNILNNFNFNILDDNIDTTSEELVKWIKEI